MGDSTGVRLGLINLGERADGLQREGPSPLSPTIEGNTSVEIKLGVCLPDARRWVVGPVLGELYLGFDPPRADHYASDTLLEMC